MLERDEGGEGGEEKIEQHERTGSAVARVVPPSTCPFVVEYGVMCLRAVVRVTVQHTDAVTILFNLHFIPFKNRNRIDKAQISLLGENSS